MNEIYRRAEYVLIWLQVPANVSYGFRDWSDWKRWHEAQATARPTDLRAAYATPQPMDYHTRAHNWSGSLITAWENVQSIFESPWWVRAWVYQEFLLAKRATFLIAGLEAPWGELRQVLKLFLDSTQSHLDAVRAAQTDQNTLDETQEPREQRNALGKAVGTLNGILAGFQHLHTMLKHYLTLNPLRRGSLFAWIYDMTYGARAAKERKKSCLYFCAALFLFIFVGPFAFIEYALTILFAPMAWAITSCPSPFGREGQAHGTQGATEMIHLFNNRLSQHVRTLSAIEPLSRTAQSLLTNKLQVPDGAFRPLSDLLRHARNCECRDPRDKVFAFLGVADPSYGIVADYTSTNTWHNVMTQATAAVIKTEQSLNILNDARADSEISRAKDHLPSWVPNFTTSDRENDEYERFIKGIGLPLTGLAASKQMRATVQFCSDHRNNPERVLRTRGIRIGRLTRLVEDPAREPWRIFEDDSGREIRTGSRVSVHDEVWVLVGADVPFVLAKPSAQDDSYEILGQATIWENEKPSSILYGSMIDRFDRGELSAQEVSLI